MRNLKGMAAGVALVGLFAGTAEAQADIRNLGREATLSATCLMGTFMTSCTQAQVTLMLDGLQATDNMGMAVPAGVVATDERRFASGRFEFFGPGNATSFVSTPAGFTSSVDASGIAFLSDPAIPLTAQNVTFVLNLSGGMITGVGASGLSYLDANLSFVNAAGVELGQNVIPTSGGPFYRTADFNEVMAISAIPEPSTYALMATGLIALGGFARRRRLV